MGLPNGFQPRPCVYCGSRHLMNQRREDNLYQVTCFFCLSSGPTDPNQDRAWLAWNGDCVKAPKLFGSPAETVL